MTNIEIKAVVEEVLRIKTEKAILESKEKELTNILKEELTTRDLIELICEGHIIKNTPVVTVTFNSKLFGEKNPDIYKMYTRETHSTRFSIK